MAIQEEISFGLYKLEGCTDIENKGFRIIQYKRFGHHKDQVLNLHKTDTKIEIGIKETEGKKYAYFAERI